MKSDEQLRSDVEAELKWDPSVNPDLITVVARNGVVTLSGTVPHFAEKWAAERATQRVEGVETIAEEVEVDLTGVHIRNDSEIAQAVLSSFGWHVWIPSSVKAKVENGWVTLSGTVKWDYQRSAAKDAVRYLTGVRGVSNNITLDPQVKASSVKDQIEKALERDAEVDAKNIKVAINGGTVTLAGKVGSWGERVEAGTAAFSASGVTEVVNNLVVSY